MTTETLLRPRTERLRRIVGAALAVTLKVALPALKTHTRPLANHIREHLYTIAGFGFVSAAAFTHSVFSGLLVTGLLFLVFEWKVND